MRKTIGFLLLLLILLPGSTQAQTPYLVRDINTTYSTGTESSSPTDFAAFRNKVFFVATTDSSGTELWSTDGTSGGTSMVADIIPGVGSSNPSGLRVVNGVLLFSARDVNYGIELWTSDGTAAGTRLFLDINPGPSSGQPTARTLYKDRMIFGADDGTAGRELWITDGTVGGTRMLKDISPGSASSFPGYFGLMGDSLYFVATGGLWKTNGTEAGTVKVASVIARNLAVADSRLFFEGITAATGWELWTSDGSESGTSMVSEIVSGTKGGLDTNYSALGFAPFGDKVLFLANDGVHGREMWISDGTAAGTRMVRDVTPGTRGTWDNAYAYITTLNNRGYFSASDDAHGLEVWITDGTETGTSLFYDINPGTASSYPFVFVVSGGKLYFAANSAFAGTRLWVTDGTSGGLQPVGGLQGPGLGSESVFLWPVDGKLYFRGTTPLSGSEPWVTDGTDGGTRMIANLAADRAPSSSPIMLTAAGSLMYFYATEGIRSPTSNIAEWSLWRSDGTAAGTFKLQESGQHPATLIPAGPRVFFYGQINSRELMMSDGTPGGTQSAADFLRRFGESRVESFFQFDDALYVTASDPAHLNDPTLWKTTGDLDAPAIRLGSTNPYGPIDVAGRLFFFARGSAGVHNRGLWTTDGTPSGTYAVVPELDVDYQGISSNLAAASGTLFFIKQVRDQKANLWKSDGTLDGTTIVKEIPNAGAYGSQIKGAGRNVFFVTGGALWVSDGTETGTIELMNLSFSPSYENDNLRPVGSRIVFARDVDGTGFELWSSDGTVAGTRLLRNLGNNNPTLVSIDGLVYFAGTDDVHGTEVWTTDGTMEGTKLLADVNAGAASSNPLNFTKLGNQVYFTAYTDATGAELWALPMSDSTISVRDSRTVEGDAAASAVRMNVSLNAAATQAVTVEYVTSDGTAKAGDDYDAASGRITFAPGETTSTIAVPVRPDLSTEGNETFFVTLRNASGALVIKAEAVGIIEDDDASADLSVAPTFTESSRTLNDSVTVANNGPRAATDVVVRFTSTPDYGPVRCETCSIPQITAGGSAATGSDYWPPHQQAYVSASVTARQRDPQTSNNATAWTLNGLRTIAMNAAYLTPDATATITATTFTTTPLATSSDPSVVSISPITNVNDRLLTFTVTAIKAGTSTINVNAGQYPLVVTVVPPGTTPRWPGALIFQTDFTATPFNKPLKVTVTPSATAPFTGATATGTVIATAGGRELARRVLQSGVLEFPLYLPSLGSVNYQLAYSGDANFLPQTVNLTVFVSKAPASLIGELRPVSGSPGTFTLTVRAAGSPMAAPTGTITVTSGAVEIAKLSLASAASGTSEAQTTVRNVPPSATLTINYSGDDYYLSGTQQVRQVDSRRRAVRR